MRGKVSCLRKQYDGRNWASNHRPLDLKSNALTTTPARPRRQIKQDKNIYLSHGFNVDEMFITPLSRVTVSKEKQG